MISLRMGPKDRGTVSLLAALTLFGLAAVRPCASAPASAGVSQLSGGMVYVEAGRKDGLLEGDTLIVMRAGKPVAWLRAAYLASHRAACDTLRLLSLPKAGDLAQFTDRRLLVPAGPSLPGGAGASPAWAGIAGTTPASARKPSLSRLKGRVGLTYLLVDTDGRGRLSQAAVDARVLGTHLWGAPLDWTADVRTRRVSYDRAGGVTIAEGLTRVYRFNMSGYDASGRYFVTLGRQTASALASVSIFDGALAEARGRRWNSGLFVGAQPEPIRLGLSGEIMEMGAYVEYHQPEGSESHWSVTGGGVSSRQAGSPNRDFTFAQFYYTDGGLSLSASQEIDVNRGWKRDLGEPLLSPTSTFLSASARVAPHLSARGGYDNRRNVRLYRDYITPETAFDDRFRRGAWAGLTCVPAPTCATAPSRPSRM